jgi:hypothetical protein
MNYESIFQELDNLNNKWIEKCDESKTPAETFAIVTNFTSEFKKNISSFFLPMDNSDKIRKIYSDIKENKFPNKTVCCIDIRNVTSIYTEYNTGMLEFISEIIKNANINCDNIDDNAFYNESLDKACAKDNEFIKSLFDDSKCEQRNLSDAMYNFEYLIDFTDVIDKLIASSRAIVNVIDTIDSELISRSIKLLCCSIMTFVYTAIKNMINTFGKVIDSINREEQPKVNFQLF